ncbi:MAG: hypothetical protein F4052_07980 [Dehalococcoidia bacterium]|nr:hypothetical protein [Dehalococcoidia bacterium]MYK26870.1 hypothetical protein [Dehalococcoidia bacterium]
MRLTVEVEGEGDAGALPGEGSALVAFMSFAAVRGFGARHPLIALSERVADLGVRLGPLTTFYERGPEDSEDEANLERAWQDAGPLAGSLEALVAALAGDERAGAFVRRAGAESLAEEAAALRDIVEGAGRANRRVRLTYEL